MRVKVAAVLVGSFLVLASQAQGYANPHPLISERTAERGVLRFLHSYPGWRYRRYGYVDCRFGRINSYSWGCRVGWVGSGHCRLGRVRITNIYGEQGYTHYSAVGRTRHC